MTIRVDNKEWWQKFTTTALDDAGQYFEVVADKALRDKERAEGRIDASYRPIILNYTDRSWNWDFSSRVTNTVVVKKESKETLEAKEKREEEEAETRAKVIGVGSLLGALGILGWAYRHYERHQQTVQYTEEVRGKLLAYQPIHPDLKDDLLQLVWRLQTIDTLSRDKMQWYVRAACVGVAGGISLVLGGFRVTPFWTIKMGYLGAIAAAAAGVFNLAYRWGNGEEIKKHYRVILGGNGTKGLAHMILENLEQYDPQLISPMKITSTDLPPLYPSCHNPAWANPPHLLIPSAPQ